jgi:isopenicillin N synthase-like dioxygenase
MLATSTFAVIDLTAPSVADVAAACCGTGLFFVANHGVDDALVAAHFAHAREFFALSAAEKGEIAVGGGTCFRGYEPLGTQTIDATAPGDVKEGFIMGPDLRADHPHVVAGYPNTGANRWPRRPPSLRGHMETYVAAMNRLARRLAATLARSLELDAAYFGAALAEPSTYAQLFHYPALRDARATAYGAAAHVDWGLLTILLQDDVGGLEFLDRDGVWQAVPPRAGTFVVIVGELMVRLTGGRYRAAPHRVARNAGPRGRYSMPTFVDPSYDWLAACVPTCVPPGGEARYPARTVAQHLREMARATLTAELTPERPR